MVSYQGCSGTLFILLVSICLYRTCLYVFYLHVYLPVHLSDYLPTPRETSYAILRCCSLRCLVTTLLKLYCIVSLSFNLGFTSVLRPSIHPPIHPSIYPYQLSTTPNSSPRILTCLCHLEHSRRPRPHRRRHHRRSRPRPRRHHFQRHGERGQTTGRWPCECGEWS